MNNGPEMRDDEDAVAVSEFAALETELARLLRPIDLPAGFADRVLAASAAAPSLKRAKVLPFLSWRGVAGGALAASLVAGLLGAEAVHQRHERERAEAAAQQLETAMRVTNHALEETRAQLARAGFRL